MSKTISCPNCGAKYKVPEDTKASRAKCKACGTVIDIQAQLHAAPAASAAPQKPAPAPKPKEAGKTPEKTVEKDVEIPVSARKKNPSREGIRRAASKSRSGRTTRGRSRGGEEEEGTNKRAGRSRGARTAGAARGSRGARGGRGGRGARGRGENAPEEKSKTPMYLGIGGGVIAVAIAAFFLFKGSENKTAPKKATEQVASTQEGAKKEISEENPGKRGAKTANALASKDETSGKKAAEASAAKTAEPKKTPKKAAKKPAAKKKKKSVYGESSTPFDAKSLDPLPFTEDTTEEEKADLKRWAKKMLEDTGFPGRKARDKIIKMGRKGVPVLINALREIDYTTKEGADNAALINDGLSQIFLGLNVGFNLVQGKPKDEVAWWNAKCVRTWMRQWENIGGGDKEAFDRFIKARRKKMK